MPLLLFSWALSFTQDSPDAAGLIIYGIPEFLIGNWLLRDGKGVVLLAYPEELLPLGRWFLTLHHAARHQQGGTLAVVTHGAGNVSQTGERTYNSLKQAGSIAQQRGNSQMKPVELFGVVVRAIGLIVVLLAVATLFPGILALVGGGPGAAGLIIYGVPELLVGFWLLLGGKRVVQLAYPEELLPED